MEINHEFYSKGSLSIDSITGINVIPSSRLDSEIIPISWWWITNGCPIFKALEDGFILASGYTNNDTRIIEGQIQNKVFFPMFKTELLREGIEGSKAWCVIENKMRILARYASKLGMLEGLRFYGWFERHMNDMGLGCSNILLEPNQFDFDRSEFIEELPKKFNPSTGKWAQ